MRTKRLKCGIPRAKSLTTGGHNSVLQVQFKRSASLMKENIIAILLLTNLVSLLLIAAEMQSILIPFAETVGPRPSMRWLQPARTDDSCPLDNPLPPPCLPPVLQVCVLAGLNPHTHLIPPLIVLLQCFP